MALPENETDEEYFQRRAEEERLLAEEDLASIEATVTSFFQAMIKTNPELLQQLLEAGELTQEEVDEILAQLGEPDTETA